MEKGSGREKEGFTGRIRKGTGEKKQDGPSSKEEERKTALVTGASRGLGLSFARLLAEEGHDLVLVARSEEKLNQVKEELERAYGVTAYVCPADLSQVDAALRVFAYTEEQGLRVDVLVNNAGFGDAHRFADCEWQKQADMVQVDITAVMQLTRFYLPGMLERKRGAIINLSSVAAFCSGPYMSVYYAAKAFVRSFSEAVAEEVKGSGVTVTALCPGPTATGFEASAQMGRNSRMFRRAAKAEDVAKAGIRALHRGRVLCYQGAFTKCMAFLSHLVPRSVTRKFATWMNEKGR